MNTANAAFWTVYAISIADFYIMIPNGLGVLLGIVQVFLVLIFPRLPLDGIDIMRGGNPSVH